MTNLKNIPTCELVNELHKREGVTQITTTLTGTDIIISINNDGGLEDYHVIEQGPSIILRIID